VNENVESLGAADLDLVADECSTCSLIEIVTSRREPNEAARLRSPRIAATWLTADVELGMIWTNSTS
jgi:hypothetical protein